MSLDNNTSNHVHTALLQKDKPSLILSQELMNQVNFLHNRVKKDEWSGILLYKIISGDIENPKDLVLQADYIYPMDIGSSAYTEFDYDEAYVDMHTRLPIVENGVRKYKIGTIHTHHSMDTFFSGTDTGELHTNSPHHNFYLSLIVNFSCNYIAKIACYSPPIERVMKFKGSSGDYERTAELPGVLLVYDCNILFELPEWFNERFAEVEKKKKTPIYTKGYMGNDSYFENFSIDKKNRASKKVKETSLFDEIHKSTDKLLSKNTGETDFVTVSHLCKTISGNMYEFSDIYNVIKRVNSQYKENKDKFTKANYLYSLRQRVTTNFKVVCEAFKGRKPGVFEMDEYAERAISILNSYKFEDAEDIMSSIKLGLSHYLVKQTASYGE